MTTVKRGPELPCAWRVARFDELLARVERKILLDDSATYRCVGVRWYGLGAFERESLLGMNITRKQQWVLKAGDVVYNKLFAWKGAFAIADDSVDGQIVSDKFPTYQINTAALEPRYLHYYFRTARIAQQALDLSKGAAAISKLTLNPPQFWDLTIPLPPLDEQRRIVASIEELAAKIKEARVLRAGLLVRSNALVSAQTSELFDKLAVYPTSALGDLGEGGRNPIQIGPFGAQLHSSEFVEHGVPVLNVGNVWPDGLKLDKLDRVLPEKAAALSRYALKTEDLLFARSGATLGKVCIVPEYCDGWLMSAHLFRVRLDKTRCLPEFAFSALRGDWNVRNQVFERVRGATRPGFNTTLLSNVRLPIPPVLEQRRIVDQLDELQARVSALRQLQAETAAELDALLSSILDRAFRGEL